MIGPGNQNYMLPVREFYLANRQGTAEIAYLCMSIAHTMSPKHVISSISEL